MPYKIKFESTAGLGNHETLMTKTLVSAIKKAVALSKRNSNVRYEIYYQAAENLEYSLMMAVKNGVNVESKGEVKRFT